MCGVRASFKDPHACRLHVISRATLSRGKGTAHGSRRRARSRLITSASKRKATLAQSFAIGPACISTIEQVDEPKMCHRCRTSLSACL